MKNEQSVGHAVSMVNNLIVRGVIPVWEIPKTLKTLYDAVISLDGPIIEPVPEPVPAVPVKKSVTPDFIVCLDDGRSFRSLKRHIATLGMTPAEYRTKWNLPADYPMVAPNYSAIRANLAKASGLGTLANKAKKPVPKKSKRAA